MPHARAAAGGWAEAEAEAVGVGVARQAANGPYEKGFATQVFINTGVTHSIGN
jgi:hypothetical protein